MRTFNRETLCFCIVIAFLLGLVFGYGWRMTQVDEHKIEKDIVQSLKDCTPLITDELIISPTWNCEKINTAVVGLRK